MTMKKHPSCFKLEGELAALNETKTDKPVTLYKGWMAHLLTCFFASFVKIYELIGVKFQETSKLQRIKLLQQ